MIQRPEGGPGPGAERELDGALRGEVAEAANVLARLGLVTAYGHISARAGESMLITPAADLAGVTAASVIEVPLATGARPTGALPREHCLRARRPRRGRTWLCTGPGRTRRRSPVPSRPPRSRSRPWSR